MKKIFSICVIALSFALAASAQQPGEKKHEGKNFQALESEKIAFITRVVDITPEEAGPFWALYNKLEKEQKSLFSAERDAFKALNKALKEEGTADADVEKLLKAYLSAKNANIDVHAKHSADYKKMVGSRKTAAFFAAQERFRRQQINRLRHSGQKPKDGQKPYSPAAQPQGK